jgi:penicillin amidase
MRPVLRYAFSLVLLLAFPTPLLQAAPDPSFGPIEILRDKYGVPHVFSDTDAGAMYGLGYVTARDRGFQIHYSLRIIQGRLAEVVGLRPSGRRNETALDNDRKMRTFGFYRAAVAAAERLDDDTRAMFTAYCHGVNDSLAAQGDSLHPLFRQLGLEPELWTPADCIASFWHLGQFLAADGTRELITYRQSVGRPGRAARSQATEPASDWLDDDAAVVTRADVTTDWLDKVQAFARKHGLSPASQPATQPATAPAGPKFSHAWVVSGRKTGTGSAALVSDPQTPVRSPSLWMEFHVRGKTFNARGVGVPGCPGLLVGWNEHVAWGVTALGADQADLFRLHTDAERPDQYKLDNEWKKMQVLHETIRVKGGRSVGLKVRLTDFGPVVTPFAFAAPKDPEVALKRVPICTQDTRTSRCMLAMMRARSTDDFGRAIDGWQFPSMNIVFGDRRGHIGYWLIGAIPVRSSLDAGRGAAAVDGTSTRYDWQGFLPHDLLPHVIDPARGWIASGNHRAIGTFYPLALGNSTGAAGHTVRSWRLYERLASAKPLKPAEVLDIHFDTVNPARRDIVRIGLHLRKHGSLWLSDDALATLDVLEPWLAGGARSDLAQPGAALAGEISTFFRFTATPLASVYGGGETGLSRFLHDLASRIDKDDKTELIDEEQQFIDQALAGAWQSASDKYGDDPDRWDPLAREEVRHRKIGYFDSLDNFGSLDPSSDMTWPGLACVDGQTIHSQGSQSYTQYVPLHDVDAAQSLLPPGHVEDTDSPYFNNTVPLWQAGQLHPAPLSRAAVERIATSRTVLAAPKPSSRPPLDRP